LKGGKRSAVTHKLARVLMYLQTSSSTNWST